MLRGCWLLCLSRLRCVCSRRSRRPPPPNTQGITNNPYSAKSSAFPSFLVPPLAVVNDGRRRTLLIVNEGYNAMDNPSQCPVTGGAKELCSTAYPSAAALVTLNISAWRVPVTATLLHVAASEFSFGEVAGILVGAQSAAGQPSIPQPVPFTPSPLGEEGASFQGSTITRGGYYDTIALLLDAYRRGV